jgi:hypothetical protein
MDTTNKTIKPRDYNTFYPFICFRENGLVRLWKVWFASIKPDVIPRLQTGYNDVGVIIRDNDYKVLNGFVILNKKILKDFG